MAKRVVSRDGIDAVLDHVRFRIDTFPHGVYQPVASLPRVRATRGVGSESRWEAILPVVREQAVETRGRHRRVRGLLLDHARRGRDRDDRARRRSGGVPHRDVRRPPKRSHDVGVLALALTPSNVVAVPASDCTICLSIWHHLVRYNGVDEATRMMATIWSRTGKVLFFDTGENEMSPEYGLPAMTPDARSWLTSYLAETCPARASSSSGRTRRSIRRPARRAEPVRGHPRLSSTARIAPAATS